MVQSFEIRETENKNLEVISGDPKKAIMFLFWPLLITFVTVNLNGYFDKVQGSFLGASQQSAVSVMSEFYIIIASFGAGIGVACAVSISYYLGKKDNKTADLLASHALILQVLVSLVLSFITHIITPLVIDFASAQSIRDECMGYIEPIIFFNVTFTLNGALCGILRGEGDVKRVIIATLLNLTQFFFNPLFIFVFNAGVSGASFGTIAGSLVSTGYILSVFCKNKTHVKIAYENFTLKLSAFRELLSIGLPYSGIHIVRRFSNIVNYAIIAIVAFEALGDATIAVFSFPMSYVHLFECVGMAFAAALIPVLSYNLGRNDKKLLDETYHYAFRKALLPIIVIQILMLVAPGPFLIIFIYDPSLNQHFILMIYVLALMALAVPSYPIRDISYALFQTIRKAEISFFFQVFQFLLIAALMYEFGTLWGQLEMIQGFVLGNWIGAILIYFVSYHYWKKFRVENIKHIDLVSDDENQEEENWMEN